MMQRCVMWSNGFFISLDLRPGLPSWGQRAESCLLSIGMLVAIGFAAFGERDQAFKWLALLMILPLAYWRIFRRQSQHVNRAMLAPDGRWRIWIKSNSGGLPASLTSAWFCGRWAGLSWRSPTGQAYWAWLRAQDCSADQWRRLRVRLRLPLSDVMT